MKILLKLLITTMALILLKQTSIVSLTGYREYYLAVF